MSWPPPTRPTNLLDGDPQLTTHKSEHNAINLAMNDTTDEITADHAVFVRGGAGVDAKIIPATGQAAQVRTDAGLQLRSSSGAVYGDDGAVPAVRARAWNDQSGDHAITTAWSKLGSALDFGYLSEESYLINAAAQCWLVNPAAEGVSFQLGLSRVAGAGGPDTTPSLWTSVPMPVWRTFGGGVRSLHLGFMLVPPVGSTLVDPEFQLWVRREIDGTDPGLEMKILKAGSSLSVIQFAFTA